MSTKHIKNKKNNHNYSNKSTAVRTRLCSKRIFEDTKVKLRTTDDYDVVNDTYPGLIN